MPDDSSSRWTPPQGALIGMIHVGALPGAPRNERSVREIAQQAGCEAKTLAEVGFDAIIVENMHDAPYLRGEVGPEIVSAMTTCALAVRDAAPDHPLGVQILAGANRAALAVALASDAAFIRAENFVFAHVADEGLMPEADAAPLLRERRRLAADHIAVFADLKKKHASHAITADISLAETAHAAEFSGADGVIVTGASTGDATPIDALREASDASALPVLAGSGVTAESVKGTLAACRGVIVGSSIKEDGDWRRAVDAERARAFVEAAKG